jgi:hypothetical protein
MQTQISKEFMIQLHDAKPCVKGTTLITYIVSGLKWY